ncbi:MAG TPA: hypothetical protein VE032_05650 [Actinomycetota bacterium]|nr:hypothetical protein [Actinomycetota bacterium]
MAAIAVALEVGRKRTFATALEWPGWCRPGRDEDAALEALAVYRPRYAAILRAAHRRVPGAGDLEVLERLPGSATTDFGAPGAPPAADAAPVTSRDLARLTAILEACWDAFDAAVTTAHGRTLRTGPRGGGRTLDGIVEHVTGGERSYLGALGGSARDPSTHGEVRRAFIAALGQRARGKLPDVGPRGGARWSPRFVTRYTAWHTTDHLWEIEDRAVAG